MPTPQNLHHDPLLSEFAARYTNSQFIADIVCPVMPVDYISAAFKKGNRADENAIDSDYVGATGTPNEIDNIFTEDTYSLRGAALMQTVQSASEMTTTAISPEEDAVANVRQRIMLAHEARVASIVFNAANFAAANTYAGTDWTNTSTGTPLTDIQRAYAPLTIVSYLPADSDAWIPDGHTTLSREWSGWAAMVADPTFAGGDSRATNVGEKPGRYLTTTFGPLGIFWRNRWVYSPWAGCSRAVTLWALPATSSSGALDGLGDFVPTANVLQPISIAPAGTLQFSWDSWDSESFTPSASPPADPPYTWLGHLSSWRLTAAYSFTNA
jgi:hypothetical protein